MNIKQLPKAEIHVHLEGATPIPTVERLAEKNGVDLSSVIKEGKYVWSGFPEFLKAYDKVCEAFKTEEDFEVATYDYLKRQAAENVFYNEIIISPTHSENLGVGYENYLNGIISGLNRAEKDFGITCRLIVTIVRSEGIEGAKKVIELTKSVQSPLVTGLHIAGDETFMSLNDFKDYFNAARDMGLGLSAHAGEVCGPDEVRRALNLGVTRIGHGIASIQDGDLVKELVSKNICLEVCPTSNLCTGVYCTEYKDHPLRRLYDAGVKVTINSDDPPFFGSWLEEEYQIANTHFNFNEKELLEVTKNAIDFAFIAEDDRKKLYDKIAIEG